MAKFEDSSDVKRSTSYEIGQSETRANQLIILEAVTSHQKFECAAPSDYSQFHLPQLCFKSNNFRICYILDSLHAGRAPPQSCKANWIMHKSPIKPDEIAAKTFFLNNNNTARLIVAFSSHRQFLFFFPLISRTHARTHAHTHAHNKDHSWAPAKPLCEKKREY